ncbi:hypothetical protein PT974_07681 [Cladobotryum mycophilum]|uniref:Uncharacterized protein n=1 Tax=Cladobotryum mycophilum TaxID=491253 RepID=A0ABR0SQ43_9HYPO
MKRRGRAGPGDHGTRKKQKIDDEANLGGTVGDALTPREEAKPYRLGIARLSLDSMDFTWERGKNRPLDEGHARKFCSAFGKGALLRQAEENYLVVTCSRAAAEKAFANVDPATAASDLPVLDFVGLTGERARVLAGQHRMAGLKMHVEARKLGHDELWWTCEVYDAKLPPDLALGLSVNRQDIRLPDGHGEVWMQLAAASERDRDLFSGNRASVEARIQARLHLGGDAKFPLRRFLTLWRNTAWRDFITRWCSVSLGKENFTVSAWSVLASRRIDAFWFDRLEAVLSTLSVIDSCVRTSVAPSYFILARDWELLGEAFERGGSLDALVDDLFFPQEGQRRRGFLTHAARPDYDKLHGFLRGRPDLAFPPFLHLTEMKRDESERLKLVMMHVVAWVDPASLSTKKIESNGHSLLRDDLTTALEGVPGVSGDLGEMAASIQTGVLNYSVDLLDDLRALRGSDLEVLPGQAGPAYGDRFVRGPFWPGLLELGLLVDALPEVAAKAHLHRGAALDRLSSKPRGAPARADTTRVVPSSIDEDDLRSDPAMDEMVGSAPAARTIDLARSPPTPSPRSPGNRSEGAPGVFPEARGIGLYPARLPPSLRRCFYQNREAAPAGSGSEFRFADTPAPDESAGAVDPNASGDEGYYNDGLPSHASLYESDGDSDTGSSQQGRQNTANGVRNGEFVLNPTKLASIVCSDRFDAQRAMSLLQTGHSIDYGRQGFRVRPDDELRPEFFLDFLSVIGRPLCALSPENPFTFFDSVKLTLKNWASSYNDKHVRHLLPFSLAGRTFRIASGGANESWFIVMHPRQAEDTSTRRPRRVGTALSHARATLLSVFIVNTLETELQGRGVDSSWSLGGPAVAEMGLIDWAVFQKHFMDGWAEFARHQSDLFWAGVSPAFHAYGYGANYRIRTDDSEFLSMEETLLDSDDELDHGSDLGSDGESNAGSDDDLRGRLSPSPEDVEESDGDEREGEESSLGESSAAARHEASGSVADDEPSEREKAVLGCIDKTPGLSSLKTALDHMYKMESVESISYALACNINCLSGKSWGNAGVPLCLLGDLKRLKEQYGNFTCTRPPTSVSDAVAPVAYNMAKENYGAEILDLGYFQCYSNIKRAIRFRPEQLLVTKAIPTGALTLHMGGAGLSGKARETQQRLLRHLSLTDRGAPKPFARERRFIHKCIETGQFAFRMEQVVSVRVSGLRHEKQNSANVLRPIVQLVSFFSKERGSYDSMLRAFPSNAFPGILTSFATIFETVIDEMHRRFAAGNGQGLPLPSAEGVAAIDRLANFCFTGDPRCLPTAIFENLGTLRHLQHHAWPYISKAKLDLYRGSMNMVSWPKGRNDGPRLLHTAALAFYYGLEVAANRGTHLWVQHMIEQRRSKGDVVLRVFEHHLIPEVQQFFCYRMKIALRAVEGIATAVTDAIDCLDQWAAIKEADACFTVEWLKRIKARLFSAFNNRVKVEITGLRDFASLLVKALYTESEGKRYASKNMTWLITLRAMVPLYATGNKTHDRLDWEACLIIALQRYRVSWLLGTSRATLTSQIIRELSSSSETLSMSILSALSGSLKRKALESDERRRAAQRQRVNRRIDFGHHLPFAHVPSMIDDGFRGIENHFGNKGGDPQVMGHYRRARQCLEVSMGEPLVNLMLMLVLTLAASSPMVTVKNGTFDFSVTSHSKDRADFAASLVTRMLWFLKPSAFTIENTPEMYGITEMTKKIGTYE